MNIGIPISFPLRGPSDEKNLFNDWRDRTRMARGTLKNLTERSVSFLLANRLLAVKKKHRQGERKTTEAPSVSASSTFVRVKLHQAAGRTAAGGSISNDWKKRRNPSNDNGCSDHDGWAAVLLCSGDR